MKIQYDFQYGKFGRKYAGKLTVNFIRNYNKLAQLTGIHPLSKIADSDLKEIDNWDMELIDTLCNEVSGIMAELGYSNNPADMAAYRQARDPASKASLALNELRYILKWR